MDMYVQSMVVRFSILLIFRSWCVFSFELSDLDEELILLLRRVVGAVVHSATLAHMDGNHEVVFVEELALQLVVRPLLIPS